MTDPPWSNGLSIGELRQLVVQLLERVAELDRTVAQQREEIARLKGLKSRPAIKPTGMEKAITSKPARLGKRRRREKSAPRVSVGERTLSATALGGSPHKGYENFAVQDLVPRTVQPRTRFVAQAAWETHLDRLEMSPLQVTPDPVQIATERALWGGIHAHGFLRGAAVVSDSVGQFAIGWHAPFWMPAERLVHKLNIFTDLHRKAQQRMRALIWWFSADLKSCYTAPTGRRRSEMRARFDCIFARGIGFVMLDRLLQQLHVNKAELLTVLDRI